MGVEVEDVALPVDPEVHVVAGFLPEQLEAHLGVGGEVLFGIEEGEHEAVVLGTVEVAEHEGEPPEVGLGAEPGEGVDAVLILVALPSGDVVEGVVGIAVGAVEEHEVDARLEAYLGDGGIDEFGLEPGARQGVALGQLAAELVVVEEEQGIDLGLQGSHQGGVDAMGFDAEGVPHFGSQGLQEDHPQPGCCK